MGRKSEGDIPLLPVHRDGPLPNDNVTGACPWGQTDYSIPGGWKDSTCCGDYKGVSTFDSSLNNNPDELYRFVSDQMMIPPRLVVQVIWNVSRNVEEPNSPSGLKRVYAQGRDEEKIADFWAPTMINAARSGLNNEEVLTMNDMDDILRRARERSDVLRIHGLENPTNGSTDNASGET
ncbi:hypothetical protein PENSTE_c011G02288 [Penicillium steckii]|uniref:Uncharacterized protein n=1 Tax=Penicillium steckii TaxID=303698 RepID=A0A1V6T7T3_9EURO|nr:hypothetical protein PENSTE_c011G02288 [Penicillium steckii]